jgi:succinoglycan biosynthesis transport protein ExoP
MKHNEEDDRWDGRPGEQAYLTTIDPRALIVRGRNSPALYRPQQDADEGPDFDIFKYWHTLVKRRMLIGAIFMAAIVLGLFVTLITTPIYRASTTIQIDRETTRVVDVGEVEPEGGNDADFYMTQYALLRSRSLAERVVSRLNLADDAAFMAQERRTPVSFMKNLIRRASGQEPRSREARERRAISLLMSGLTIEPVRGSRLVKVMYDSPDPALAARISIAVAENYIGANLDRRFEASSYARKFLEERLAQVKTKLEQSERQLVTYAQNQQLVSVSVPSEGGSATGGPGEAASQSLTAANLGAMNTAMAQAREERILAEQRWRQAESTRGLGNPELLGSATIQQLRQARTQLQTQYQEKQSVYKPDYPVMVQLRDQIEEIDRQIAAEAQTVKASLKAQYDIARRQEASLAQQVAGLSSGVLDLRGRNIQYNIIQREVDTNRTLYDGLLQRYKEIGVAGGIGTNNISLVDRAQATKRPYTPNLLLNLLVAAGAGLLLGIAAAFAIETLDQTINVPEDIEGKLGIPLLGSVPMLDKGVTPEEALSDARSAFSEAYYSVRTSLQFSTSEGVPRNLLITSARPSEGKSTTAIALARNFAKLGMSVLLVDGDLRNPSLHRALHCDNSSGLSNFLTGNAQLADVVQLTDGPNLTFMPCGPLPPNPAELLGGKRIHALLDEAGKHYDLLIIDGPPVMGLADAPLIASAVSGTLLVVAAGATRQGLLSTALKRLEVGNARILGAVLTKFSVKAAGYGYAYGYGSAYSYEYGAPQIESK